MDSAIDVSKNDQFSLSLRFVDKGGNIREYVICFVELSGASTDNYFDVLKKRTDKYGLHFSVCRGQAYDWPNTMSGQYAGLQLKVKDLSPLARHIVALTI